jgi:hypothetical protein
MFCSKQTLKNINEDSRTSRPFLIRRFSGNSNLKVPATFHKRKVREILIVSASFYCAFLADWETNIYTEPIFKVHSATPAWLGQAGWDHHISLKKIVENVSWNKSMLNSRFYWLVAFHYLEARQILLVEKIVKSKKDYGNAAARIWDVIFRLLSSQRTAAPWRKILFTHHPLLGGAIIIR